MKNKYQNFNKCSIQKEKLFQTLSCHRNILRMASFSWTHYFEFWSFHFYQKNLNRQNNLISLRFIPLMYRSLFSSRFGGVDNYFEFFDFYLNLLGNSYNLIFERFWHWKAVTSANFFQRLTFELYVQATGIGFDTF